MFQNANTYLIFLEYSYIFKYGIISLGVSILLFSLSIFFVYQKPEKEKMSVYECGFHPYGDARNKFEVKYYIVGILFIIFDLEIMYIFSWVISWWFLNFFGICIMFLFLFLLIIGFVYELFLGAIDLYFLRSKKIIKNIRKLC